MPAKPPKPPSSDELEISLFGPGFGECVLVHLRAGAWMIVDSCRDQRTRQQPALAYLRAMGVDPVQAVRIVVATHWHDDHVAGLSEVVRTCVKAKFFCTDAISETELEQLVLLAGGLELGLEEFSQIIQFLQRKGAHAIPELRWAIEGRNLADFLASEGFTDVRVDALSPSDAAVTRARQEIRRLMPSDGDLPKYTPWLDPNFGAVALWVKVGLVSALLGGDLEETREPGIGWTTVVGSRHDWQPLAEVFKVPHHGSSDAHHAGVWSDMLAPKPYALIAPWTLAGHFLPTAADRSRVCRLTPRGYLTADPESTSAVNRTPEVRKAMALAARGIRRAEPATGQIRLRRPRVNAPGEPWDLKRFAGAFSMC